MRWKNMIFKKRVLKGTHAGRRAARVFGLFLSLCLAVLGISPVQLRAAGEEYTYTVRIFAGAQGSIDGQEMIVYQNQSAGSRITFNQNRVTLKDNSKYYVRGIRKSGRDNDEIMALASFTAEEDADYVVAYGILGDAVMYTVEYVDAAGNTLAPSETYYGNVGDRPVVAFAYIEGYQPQAYNLTGTLDADASRNVFRFTYTPTAQVQEPAPEQTPAPAPEGTPEETPAPAGEETPEADTPEPGGEETPDPGEDIGENETPLAQPNELEDINDPDVPLASGPEGELPLPAQPNGFAKLLGNIPLAAKVLIGTAAVAAVGAAWFFLMYRRKKAAVPADGTQQTKESKKQKGSEK